LPRTTRQASPVPAQEGVQRGVAGGQQPVQPDLVDPFDAGQQIESEQPGQPEPDLGFYVDNSTIQASPPSSVCDFAIAGKQRDVDRLHLLSALPRVLDVCERQTGELVDRRTWCQGTGQPLDRVA
jgi:hypothetical protein